MLNHYFYDHPHYGGWTTGPTEAVTQEFISFLCGIKAKIPHKMTLFYLEM